MHVGHITSSISRVGAGVAKAVRDLSEAQIDAGDTIHIFTLLDSFSHSDKPTNKSIKVSVCPVTFLRGFGYSSSLRKTCCDHAKTIDIFHLHGLWMYPSWASGSIARASRIPYVISPHGMLEPWSLGHSCWKKKAAGLLFEYRNLMRAQCLHACSEQEYFSIRSFGYKGPVAIVPLGLTRHEYLYASGVEAKSRNTQLADFKTKKILLFLSRIHVKKGLDILLESWELIQRNFPEWHLVIAGDGDADYFAQLQEKVSSSVLEGSVTFTGTVHGIDKWALLKQADIFVLPTLSENFGLVIAEALACGVPVITTKGAPWGELLAENCGWWIEIGVTPLGICLVDALSRPSEQLVTMGERGRHLISSKYLVDNTAHSMGQVYNWILNGGDIPDCVRIN